MFKLWSSLIAAPAAVSVEGTVEAVLPVVVGSNATE